MKLKLSFKNLRRNNQLQRLVSNLRNKKIKQDVVEFFLLFFFLLKKKSVHIK